MSACDACKKIVTVAIDTMPDNLTCDAAGVLIAAAIVAAAGGPENPVGDAAAAVAGIVARSYCQKYGWPWIKSHPGEVAKAICVEAKLCL